jgi:preprotein translocase subunit SecA
MKNYISISMKKIIQVDLTDKGIQLITSSGEDPNFFVLPDISTNWQKLKNAV